MAGYQDLIQFERGVIVSAQEMEHSISKVAMKSGFSRTRQLHECTVNIGNPIKHQIYDIAAAGKRKCENNRRPTCVPLLTARHKALRLAWDLHWTIDDWNHVVWSDESRFQLNPADGRVWVWILPHESMDFTCQQGLFKLVEAM
ncbi:HTH_Tnp_Tc3_2 domain-containing protein [Trichonephila clavipes]|nr:HTH_Tnp_Tc3_2 domain-containing protein [Trichonephila clavipes]